MIWNSGCKLGWSEKCVHLVFKGQHGKTFEEFKWIETEYRPWDPIASFFFRILQQTFTVLVILQHIPPLIPVNYIILYLYIPIGSMYGLYFPWDFNSPSHFARQRSSVESMFCFPGGSLGLGRICKIIARSGGNESFCDLSKAMAIW